MYTRVKCNVTVSFSLSLFDDGKLMIFHVKNQSCVEKEVLTWKTKLISLDVGQNCYVSKNKVLITDTYYP